MKEPRFPSGQGNTSQYKLELKVPNNNAAADGIATNTAAATLTLDGSLQPKQAITFSITSGSATFKNGMQQIDQVTGSNGCATVDFTDKTADAAGGMIAWMTNNTAVESNGASYAFVAANEIKIFPAIDYAAADNASQNRVLVALMTGGGELNADYTGKVIFSIVDDTNVTFSDADQGNPQRKTASVVKGFAEASFSCASSVGNAPYQVSVTAALSDNWAPGVQQKFTFDAGGNGPFWAAYEYDAGVRQNIYANCCSSSPTHDISIDVVFGLHAQSNAYFSDQQTDDLVKFVNAKICTASLSLAGR